MELLDEPVMIEDASDVAAPVCDQPVDEKQVQANVEPPHLVISILVHEPKQKTDEVYYEFFPLPSPCHTTIMGAYLID